MQSPKQLVRIGIFYLEEAILEVLFEKMGTSPEDPFWRAADIRRKIGVYRHWYKDGWLVDSVLKKLDEEERVEQREVGGPWKLTDAEYQKRC